MFFELSNDINTDIGSEDQKWIAVSSSKDMNDKFKQEVDYSDFENTFEEHYPKNIEINSKPHTNQSTGLKQIEDPRFYPRGSKRRKNRDKTQRSMYLYKNVVLISENNKLKICNHEDSDLYERSELKQKEKFGFKNKIFASKESEETEYSYIEYCNRCGKTIEPV